MPSNKADIQVVYEHNHLWRELSKQVCAIVFINHEHSPKFKNSEIIKNKFIGSHRPVMPSEETTINWWLINVMFFDVILFVEFDINDRFGMRIVYGHD